MDDINVLGTRINLGHTAYGGINTLVPNLTLGEALDGLLALGVTWEDAVGTLSRAIMGSHTTAWARGEVVEVSKTR
jgi:hypothetical protein